MNLLAAIIDATIDQEAAGSRRSQRSWAADPPRPSPGAGRPRYYDGVYVVISEMPAGTASRPAAATQRHLVAATDELEI